MKQLLMPITIGSLTLKNRIVMAPTSMSLPAEEKMAFLGRVADGGASLIYLGDVGVEPVPFGFDCTLFTPEGRDNLRRIVERIHQGGAKAGAQLYLWDYDIQELYRLVCQGAGRGEINAFKYDRVAEYVTQMPLKRIEEIVRHFGEAAAAVKELGFDLVQVLGGHLLSSFSSGCLNHREDRYGSDVAGRAELAVQAVQAVRQAVGNMPIEYKLAVHDDAIPCGNGGPDLSELGVFVPALEAAGVDAFQAALSNRENIMDTVPAKNHPVFREEGCFLYVSDEIRRFTKLPVCCAGKLSDPQMVEKLIANRRLDYAAMSRQLVADPEWVIKVSSGREAEIRKCAFCNVGCLGSLLTHQPFYCVLDRR